MKFHKNSLGRSRQDGRTNGQKDLRNMMVAFKISLLKRLNILLPEIMLKDMPWLQLVQCGDERVFRLNKREQISLSVDRHLASPDRLCSFEIFSGLTTVFSWNKVNCQLDATRLFYWYILSSTICCNSSSNAPDDGRMYPKHVELRTHQ